MMETTKKLTLIFPLNHEEKKILLGWKKRGFGSGKFNGFGGKVEALESIREGAIRELHEECGLIANPDEIVQQGIIKFRQENSDRFSEVHVFSCTSWTGEPVESEEMAPRWFTWDEIPFDSMWPDDRIWLPKFLEKKNFHADFLFDFQNCTILDYRFEELNQNKTDDETPEKML